MLTPCQPPSSDDDGRGGAPGGSQGTGPARPPTPRIAMPCSSLGAKGGQQGNSSTKVAGRSHTSMRNFAALDHCRILLAILIAFRPCSLLNLDGLLDSSFNSQLVHVKHQNFPISQMHRSALVVDGKVADGARQLSGRVEEGGGADVQQASDQTASAFQSDSLVSHSKDSPETQKNECQSWQLLYF